MLSVKIQHKLCYHILSMIFIGWLWIFSYHGDLGWVGPHMTMLVLVISLVNIICATLRSKFLSLQIHVLLRLYSVMLSWFKDWLKDTDFALPHIYWCYSCQSALLYLIITYVCKFMDCLKNSVRNNSLTNWLFYILASLQCSPATTNCFQIPLLFYVQFLPATIRMVHHHCLLWRPSIDKYTTN